MKKSLITKIIITTILTVAIIAIGGTVLAANADYTVLQKTSTEYVVYLKASVDKDFEFAYTNSNLTDDSTLDYIKCAKDQKDGLKVAYVDEALYTQFFKDKDATYIWAKDGENYIAKGIKLDLSDVVSEGIVSFVTNTSSRISVKTDGENVVTEEKDGIKYTTTTGKLEFTAKEGTTYSYAMNANEGEYAKLLELADKINNSNSENTVTQLDNSKEFYDLYQKLIADIEWTKVENNEVLQPNDAKDGDKYIVFILEETADGAETDVQFMTSTVKTDKQFVTEEQVIQTVANLPITYDSLVLFVVLAVAVAIFAVLLIIRKKSKKESK